jgi:hypothetical protein
MNFIGIILSFSYFLNFLCRILFNTFSKSFLKVDLWLLFDIIAGVINIAAFTLIGNTTPEKMIDPGTKYFYDYYIIIVLIISWVRFFSYFLVITIIGKLTITLFRMI